MDKLDRAALEALAATLDKATKGEWRAMQAGQRFDTWSVVATNGFPIAQHVDYDTARAIVALHNAAPALLSMAMRALELEAALRESGHVICPKCGLVMRAIQYKSGGGRCSDCGTALDLDQKASGQ